MARQIDLDQLMKYPLRRGSEHCDEKNADPRFLNGVESILEWAQTLPTLTPPTPAPPCYQPDGDGCGYQCYDGDDEPIDKCKECPLCYSDKQRHHTPPNEPEYREYTCPNCHHTWLEDRDATDYPEYCPGCGEPLNRRAAEGEEGDANRG